MKRRGFLGLLTGAIASATLDPERLLWTPGRKLISIPKPVVYDGPLITPAIFDRYYLPVLVDIEHARRHVMYKILGIEPPLQALERQLTRSAR